MIPKTLLTLLLSVCVCLLVSAGATASPILDLWMTGYVTDTEIIVDVYRSNVEFDLGGLSYGITFSEELEVTREYSDHGWNTGASDNCTPADGDTATLLSVTFETIKDPEGSGFSEGAGIVETLTFSLPADESPHWIYFDLEFGFAADGGGFDLSYWGGTPNVIDADGLPEAHTFGVEIVPEPASLLLISAGAILLRKRRK